MKGVSWIHASTVVKSGLGRKYAVISCALDSSTANPAGGQVRIVRSETFADLLPCQCGLGMRRRDDQQKAGKRPPQIGVAFVPPKSLFRRLEKLERGAEEKRGRAAGAGREKAVQAVGMDGKGE